MKENELEKVKVGDFVAPVRVGKNGEWTGALHQVTKVGAKRFYAGGCWNDKKTGRAIGWSGTRYILATPEMIDEVAAKKEAIIRAQDERNAFHARADYQQASAIGWALQGMTPGKNVLDRLSPQEWEVLHARLTAKCLCVEDHMNPVCPVHSREVTYPHTKNQSMAGLS